MIRIKPRASSFLSVHRKVKSHHAYTRLMKREYYDKTRVCHLEMQNGVLCGLRFRCKYALCLVFTAFDFFENIYLHNIPT